MSALADWMVQRDRVLVMGILNVTPDSFFDGGRYETTAVAVDRGLRMIDDGADIIDIGGESTRPGSSPTPQMDELDRVLPVIEGIARQSDVAISIDTSKAEVARQALEAGAMMVNDVSALRSDALMMEVVADAGAFVTLMHMQGEPASMQTSPTYENVVEEVRAFLDGRVRAAVAGGVPAEKILIDPGIGFGKRLEHNLDILKHIGRLRSLGHPVVCGLSRKSFLGALLDLPAEERLEGTIAANAVAIANGADVIRVHDPKEGRRAADVAFRLRRDGS